MNLLPVTTETEKCEQELGESLRTLQHVTVNEAESTEICILKMQGNESSKVIQSYEVVH